MKKISVLLLLAYVTACSSAPKFTSRADSANVNVPNSAFIIPVDTISFYQQIEPIDTVLGVASFYANKFHGRRTACGEVYNMHGLTAAHPVYPFDTIIRVVNLKNNKHSIVRINDRMPFRPDRIIDLSYGTAVQLDMIGDGITQVRLEILEWGKELNTNPITE